MSTIPFMPIYIADYLADTAHFTTEEHGAYLLLIMAYWQRGRPLPADSARLATIARMSNGRWTDVERTLSECFTVVDGEWRHKRIDSELEKARDKILKAKEAGKASAAARNQLKSNGRSTPVERPYQLGGNSSESSSDIEDNTYGLPSSLEAARVKKGDDQKVKNKFFGMKDDLAEERLHRRAEGLGLDVDDLIRHCGRHKARNPSAYFTSLCVQRLQTQIPGVSEDVVRSALWNKGDAAYATLLNLMVAA